MGKDFLKAMLVLQLSFTFPVQKFSEKIQENAKNVLSKFALHLSSKKCCDTKSGKTDDDKRYDSCSHTV